MSIFISPTLKTDIIERSSRVKNKNKYGKKTKSEKRPGYDVASSDRQRNEQRKKRSGSETETPDVRDMLNMVLSTCQLTPAAASAASVCRLNVQSSRQVAISLRDASKSFVSFSCRSN